MLFSKSLKRISRGFEGSGGEERAPFFGFIFLPWAFSALVFSPLFSLRTIKEDNLVHLLSTDKTSNSRSDLT